MRTVVLDIEDNKLEIVLTIIRNLKDDIIQSYHVDSKDQVTADFMKLSNSSFEQVWDNKEDSIYDKFLK